VPAKRAGCGRALGRIPSSIVSETRGQEATSARADETSRIRAARRVRRRSRGFRAGLLLLLVLACASAGVAPGVDLRCAFAAEPPAAHGAALFAKYCATCHGDRAQGYAADHAPSLATSTFQASATDEFLRAAIERGRPGTEMAGYGKAVGGPLDD